MIGICQDCKELGKIHIHHEDGNHDNDVFSNRRVLCPACHRKTHINMRVAKGERPSAEPLSERLPYGYNFPGFLFDEVKRQYQACFPRA